MRIYAASFLLACTLASVAQTSPGASQPAATPSANISTYRNDTLRLIYSYPSNYVDATALVAPAFEASLSQDSAAAAVSHCVTLPFSRMAAAHQTISMVLLIRADAGCLKKKLTAQSVSELTQGEAKGIMASGAQAHFGEPKNFNLAGRPASSLDGSFNLPTGQSMQARVVCVLDQPDIACWQFLSNTAAGIATLSGFPVTFDGSRATALLSTPAAP